MCSAIFDYDTYLSSTPYAVNEDNLCFWFFGDDVSYNVGNFQLSHRASSTLGRLLWIHRLLLRNHKSTMAEAAPRFKKQGILTPIILIAFLSAATFFFISSESSEFRSVSKYYADTSYERVIRTIYPGNEELTDGVLEMRRGIEGLYLEDVDADDSTLGYDSVDDFEAAFEAAFQASVPNKDVDAAAENPYQPKKISEQYIHQILSSETSKNAELLPSPACRPHFNLALPNGEFNNTTKFKRIYLYHARKAGGSSMSRYFSTVARQYGLEYKAREWGSMEEPGYADSETFYVAHIREPVDRSISHFKCEFLSFPLLDENVLCRCSFVTSSTNCCGSFVLLSILTDQGRWHCKNLTVAQRKGHFIPTEENANKLETWVETGGHEPSTCKAKNGEQLFWLGDCAVNCYTQWFSGLSCPKWNISQDEQYTVAKRRVLRFNLIVVVEKLKDPMYVQAIENMFGVPGVTKKGVPFCERLSHKANADNPLLIQNKTRERLTKLNELDINFYNELGGCLNDQSAYNFPEWAPHRFDLDSYNWTEAKIMAKAAKEGKNKQ